MLIASSIDASVLRDRLEAVLPRALSVLEEMVNINSFTGHAAGVDAVGDVTQGLFEPLGFAVQRPQAVQCQVAPGPAVGRHMILTRPGRSGRRIGLVGHFDTVYTQQEEHDHDFRWRRCGDRIYGPGTVDMKAGNVLIWMILHTLRDLSPGLFDDITWVVMFNAAEEGLSTDFGVLERQHLGEEALANLVFEGGHYIDAAHHLTTSRKGKVSLHAVARGRSAHAGVVHEQGANAIVQISDFIGRVSRLTDYDRDLTCNVGVVRGGTTRNRVPEHAEALIEMRAFDDDVLYGAAAAALELDGLSTVTSPADGFAATMQVRCTQRVPCWPVNPGSDRLLALWRAVGSALGETVVGRRRGGLSDGNFTYAIAPTLDGLGPAGGNSHCSRRADDGSADQEFVLPGTFVPRAILTTLALDQLVRQTID